MKRINLLPPEFTRGKKILDEAGTKQKMLFFVFIFVLVLAGHYGLQLLQFNKLNAEVGDLRLKLESAETSSITLKQSESRLKAQLENLEQKISIQGKKKSEMLGLMQTEFRWSEVLAALNKSIPDKVWVDGLVLSREKSEVLGGTYATEHISKFIDRLNESPFFGNAAFKRTEADRLNDREIVNFEVTFDLLK